MRASCIAALAASLPAQVHWQLQTQTLPFGGQTIAVYVPTARQALVLASSNETWALSLDTGAWVRLTDGSTGRPGWRSDAGIAHDEARARTVLFGGNTLADTWEFDGLSWQQRTLPLAPPARHDAGMCYDEVARVVRLAGGDAAAAGSPAAPLSDAWSYDGVQWQLIAGPVGPSGPTAMAFDQARGRCVALAANGTFELSNGVFVQVQTAVSPPPRSSTAMVYDSLRHRIVLHGGLTAPVTVTDDVWEYDGTSWVQRMPLGIFAGGRAAHGMVFDPISGVVRVFAGNYHDVRGPATTTIVLQDELRYGPLHPAVVQGHGIGCLMQYVPLRANELPWLGDTVHLTAAAPGAALFAIGFSAATFQGQPLPLALDPFGLPLCWLQQSIDEVVFAGAVGGTVTLALPIPVHPSLLGLSVFAQALVPEPSMPAGLVLTSGVALRIGGR